MRRMFISQRPDWPQFHWNHEHLADQLAAVRHEQGRLIGHMEAIGFNLRQEADLQRACENLLGIPEPG